MQNRPRRRLARAAITATSLLSVCLPAGCAESDSSARVVDDPPSTIPVDEIAAHDGHVCPEHLPQGPNPGHGFGTAEPAASGPSLPTLESAWVCQYNPRDAGSRPEVDGTTWGWVREGEANPVDPDRLPALARSLTQLAPADSRAICTDDLGPRWMVVYSHARDLTGVVVDDYGCREVRLTDEPFGTVPGDAAQEGTVPGALSGPAGLLDDIKALDRD